MAIIQPDRTPQIILPELEQAKLPHATVELRAHTYGEGGETMRRTIVESLSSLSLDRAALGVESLHLRYLEHSLLNRALPHARLQEADALIAGLRIIKDPVEIASMQRAVEITQTAFSETLPLIQSGMSELELASEVALQLLRAGSQPEVPFTPIVASGPNSALPHASPSTRALSEGDLLIIDCGATREGYVADLTRTFSVGQPESEFKRIYDLVLEANRAGLAAAAQGVPCREVDRAARAVIESGGYGKFFVHRTGHGLGLEGHEGPYIDSNNELPLASGMTFTIEPGIYLPGRGGVRIEDNVTISAQGGTSLSTFSHELQVVG